MNPLARGGLDKVLGPAVGFRRMGFDSDVLQLNTSALATSSSHNQAFNIVLLRYGFEFINDTAG
jgi:hypothetical protein